jgi:hypothetical protein
MYVHTYVCLLFVNGLIRVTPKAVRTYVHHDRKPVCIAFAPMAKYVIDFLVPLLEVSLAAEANTQCSMLIALVNPKHVLVVVAFD